ncbi:hypothetical protein DPMN_133321 [Dreissena polymorpha]|uniref:Uncharacterized protein n=1 Tax=Dreissena polymorpha TaxID=45954 RepID=A0A9D4FU43_DREPO|nr:hypothetical protein DPMN_133321 [Dreissena polymorpha]
MNTNGLLMISKREFTSRRTAHFYPNILELFVRGYLEAKVNKAYLQFDNIKWFRISFMGCFGL